MPNFVLGLGLRAILRAVAVPVPAIPVLSSPTASTIDETTASASASINVDNGLLYWVATESATQPTSTQIKAGQNHSGATVVSGVQAVSETGVQAVFGGVIGLTDGATYYVHFYAETDALVGSNIATSSSFTTGDVTAPVLSSAEGTQTGATTADLTVNTDTASGTLFWVATTSATPPSAAQIIAGQDHTGTAAIGGSRSVTASGPQAFGITDLIGSTEYWAHFVHRDTSLNVSAAITVSASFTTTSATYYFEAFHDGSTDPASMTNSTATANYVDSLGGAAAVLWSGDGLGPGTTEAVRFGPSPVTYANAVTRIRCRFRVVNQVAAKMWMRIRPENVTSPDVAHIDITDDATPDGSRVGSTTGWTNVSCTSLGSGWFQFQGDYDPSGDADLTGVLFFYMATANSTSSIVNNVADANQIAVHDLTFEQL